MIGVFELNDRLESRGRPPGEFVDKKLNELKHVMYSHSINSNGNKTSGCTWGEVAHYLRIPVQTIRKYATIKKDTGKCGNTRIDIIDGALNTFKSCPDGQVYDINLGYFKSSL